MDLKWYIKDEDIDFEKIKDRRVYNMDRMVVKYTFLIKNWIKYAQRFNPKLSPEAKSMLDEAISDLSSSNKNLSPRVIDRLFNIAKARARILLKNVIDVGDATAAIDFYNRMVKNYEEQTIAPKDVIDVAVEECYKMLSETIAGETIAYTVKELLQHACNNQQVRKYIMSGVAKEDYFEQKNNKQARNIYERLIATHKDIHKISASRHLRLKVEILGDQGDLGDRERETPSNEKLSKLSTNDAKLVPETGQQVNGSEREISKNRVKGSGKGQSPRSPRSPRRGKKGWRSSTGGTSESPNKYSCPFLAIGCHYSNT